VLLNKGRVVYQGASSGVYSYMTTGLGMSVPLDQTLSDFFIMEISEYKEIRDGYRTALNSENYCLRLRLE